MFHLIAHTGLRRGEACGLRWDDLELPRPTPPQASTHPHTPALPGAPVALGALTVRQQIVSVDWIPLTGDPKSDAGERRIPLDPATVAELHARRREQARERLAAGPAWTNTALVFTRPDGTPWHPEQISDAFTAATSEAGLPPVRLHDLRHGTATHALAAGIDIKIVQEMLGHASSSITRDTYTSVLTDTRNTAALAIAHLLNPGNDTAATR
jgi:integrase